MIAFYQLLPTATLLKILEQGHLASQPQSLQQVALIRLEVQCCTHAVVQPELLLHLLGTVPKRPVMCSLEVHI